MRCSICGVVLVISSLLFAKLKAATIQTNVDTEEPFIIRSPASDVDGFGWAAVFHQKEEVLPSDGRAQVLSKTRVLVGAPTGSYPGGLTLDDPLLLASTRTGLVYDCPIGQGLCEGVTGNRDIYIGNNINSNITNGIGDVDADKFLFPQAYSEGRLFDQAPDGLFESTTLQRPQKVIERKQEQLMGSFLYSNGDNVLACASRWVFSSLITPDLRGICFVGSRSLTGFITVAPCTRLPTVNGRFCSSGISGALANGNAIIGIPGYRVFRGAISTRSVSDAVEGTFDTVRLDGVPNLYYGFSVTVGYLKTPRSGSANKDILGSSPRHNGDNYFGAVFLHPTSTSSQPEMLVQGRQTAEFFGNSITLVDLTGDSFDELVVGAPMYTRTDAADFLVESGRVYIFFNDGSGNLDSANPCILVGNTTMMRFGFTVTNAGDLDADGRQDLVISAPYETSDASTTSTGAIYVYYGKSTKSEFKQQTPQKIHADDIVENVQVVTQLRTFGFSVSGGHDVDANAHTDLVVGGYLDKTVVVLRTRPFVNVMAAFSNLPAVDLNTENTFTVTISATYISQALTGALDVRFRLLELRPSTQAARLSFASGAQGADFEGTMSFNATGNAMVNVVVAPDVNGDPVIPYQVELELIDVDRNIDPINDLEQVPDFNDYPRYRLMGNTTLSVAISPLCALNGCTSDVRFLPISPASVELVAGQDTSKTFTVNFTNDGPEEARDLRLLFTNLPTDIILPLLVTVAGEGGAAFTCTEGVPENKQRNVTCILLARLRRGNSRSITLSVPINGSSFLGNEEDFTVNLELLTSTAENNSDINPENNKASILFQLESESNIRVVFVSFPRDDYTYENLVPTVIQGSGDLGAKETLTVRIDNTGKSTIQMAEVSIYFPAQDSDITGPNYYLYPVTFSSSIGMIAQDRGTRIENCTMQGLDPDRLDSAPNEPGSRKKRAGAMSFGERRLRRSARAEATRLARQVEGEVGGPVPLNCTESRMRCAKFSCDIVKLTTEPFDLVLEFYFDDRFYARAGGGRTFILTAYATVKVLSEFQIADDDVDDNTGMDSFRVGPTVVVSTGGPALYHAIIWPIVGGMIILVALVVLLYFVGFFRRKKMPGEDEVEGDFSAPPQPPPEEKQISPVDAEITAM